MVQRSFASSEFGICVQEEAHQAGDILSRDGGCGVLGEV